MKEAVPRPRAPERIEEVGKRKSKTKMDRALKLRVKYAECRRIELKDGECNRDGCDNFLRPARIVYGIGFPVIFFQHILCIHIILIRHTASLPLRNKDGAAARSDVSLLQAVPSVYSTARSAMLCHCIKYVQSGAVKRSICVPGGYIS